MNLDKYGFPVQDNGDAADQLQRMGMIGVGNLVNSEQPLELNRSVSWALKYIFQSALDGTYSRYYQAPTNDVTADQLIPTIAFWSLSQDRSELGKMKWVFAQNTRKQGEPNVKTIPDFMLLRALPLIIRGYNLPIIVYYCIDVLLVLAALCYTILNRGFDDVDDNNLVISLVCCRVLRPTGVSWLAAKAYRHTRAYSPEYALTRYHRAESGGNPEIGEQWVRIIKQYLQEIRLVSTIRTLLWRLQVPSAIPGSSRGLTLF